MTHRAATANLDTPYGMEVRFTFVVSDDYSLAGKSASLGICDRNFIELYSVDSGTGVLEIIGQEIQLVIPADDVGYAAVTPNIKHKYGLTVGGDFRVQGYWTAMPKCGPVKDSPDSIDVVIDDITIDISVIAGEVISTEYIIKRHTSNTTIDDTADQWNGNTDNDAFVYTLPPGVQNRLYKIVNTGTSGNSLTLTPDDVEKLIGQNESFTLTDGESLSIAYDVIDGWY